MSARVFGAAVCGLDHQHEHTPCQDAWEAELRSERGVILCVCDGAGSASHAELGARTMVAAVVQALRELAPASPENLADALRNACAEGRNVLFREAAARELPPRELACTVIAVATWDSTAAVAHIGDGAVLGRRRGTGELLVLSAPDRGEFANETWFITAPTWSDRLRVTVYDDIEVLCALTDGCQGAALVGGQAPFPAFCSPLFDFASEVTDVAEASEQVARLLDGEPLRRSSSDDKALAVALLSP